METIASMEEILAYLTEIMRGVRDEETTPKPIDLKERMRAAELLGKHYGAFSERTQSEVIVPVIIDDIH